MAQIAANPARSNNAALVQPTVPATSGSSSNNATAIKSNPLAGSSLRATSAIPFNNTPAAALIAAAKVNAARNAEWVRNTVSGSQLHSNTELFSPAQR